MLGVMTAEFIADALATAFIFIFALGAAVICFAVSAMLLLFRTSIRAGLLGVVLGGLTYLGLDLAIGGDVGVLGGIVGLIAGVAIVGVVRGFTDPLKLLQSSIATGIIALIAAGGVLASGYMWLMLLSSLGAEVFLLLFVHPPGGLAIIAISIGPLVILGLTLRSLTS